VDKNSKMILARIVSHLMGDGCVTRRYLRYNNKNVALINNFKRCFLMLFPQAHFIEGKVNSGTSFVQVQNKEIISYLFTICPDFRSDFLKFPQFFDSYETKREFISAIFDDEGCVGLRVFKKTGEIKRNLEMASKSQGFVKDIKDILEKDFMINCNKLISFKRKVNGKEFVTWKLSITGKENFIAFRNKINFFHPIKRKKLDLMIDSYL
jgi:hypothetical protein